MIIEFEQWRPVVELEGWYEVSNKGRVRRVKAGVNTHVGKVLKPFINRHGYPAVVMFKFGKAHRRTVHSLVACAWVPNTLGPDAEVHHKDEIKTHNWAGNLEWLTSAEHHERTQARGLYHKGEDTVMAKLTWADVTDIRARHAQGGVGYKTLGAEYGVAWSTIRGVIKGRTWKISPVPAAA